MYLPIRNSRQRGFVLASALILLVSLTLVAVTVAYRNTLDEMMAANQRDYLNAMTVAESGIEAGFAKVKHNVGGTWVNGDVFGQALLDVNGTSFTTASVSGGTYDVTVTDQIVNSQSVVTMKSVGTIGTADREIEIILEMRPSGSAQYAILTADDIYKISGNPVITGPYADVHTNSDIWISGNPIIAGSVTASGEVYEGEDSEGVAEGVVGGAAQVVIPHIYPPEYYQYRHIEFTADCIVRNAAGGTVADLRNGSKWRGWDCSSGDKWTFSSSSTSDLYNAFYYVRGNIVISGSPSNVWWNASFVAEGYIEVSGNPWLRPWGSQPGNDTGNEIADEILFYAGNDLKINGNSTQQFQGILATHMEIDVSGNPYLQGAIVAENGAGQEVTTGQAYKNIADNNSFSGDMRLEASGSPIFGAGMELTVTAWRELVN